MIIYFADRAMNILGSASTGLPKGLMITNDKKTEEISEGVAIFECDLNYMGESASSKKLASAGNFILKQKQGSNEAEVYTIIDSTIDQIEKTISIYAEDAGLDLLNEVVGKYEADKAYDAAYYINKFSYDSGWEIGINEISDLTRKLSWDGEETATKRILSVATQFDNAEIGFSFKVENMSVTKKYINIYKKRGNESNVVLTVGKEISAFRIKSSIADLATAYYCTGATPEGADDPITLNGYKYDDGDFYIEGSYVKSREALKKWSRYQIKTETGTDVGHIVKNYSYETNSQSELCNRAVSSLKKVCDESITYEVELLYLPDGLNIGDTVSIVDDDDNTYLTARLLKLKTSETNDTREAELGDYVKQESGMSEKVMELAERFAELAKNRNFYTWIAYADDDKGTGISLDPYGKDYLGIASNQLKKEIDISDSSLYTWTKIKGEQGIPGTDGKPGKDGVPGKNGENGETSYAHFAYATSADGKEGFSTTDTAKKTYIGQYTDFAKTGSEDPTKYRWSKFQGPQGEQGIQGEAGTAGKDAIIISKIVPENPEINQLWQTESGQPIMRWNGKEWVLHYLSVENLNVNMLSAITADLGTVTAGVIKNKSGTVNIDVEKGTIDTYDDEYNASSTYAAGTSVYQGKDPATNPATLSIDYYQIVYRNGSMGTATALTPMNGDWWVGKDPWNGDNDAVLPIYASLNHLLKKDTGMVAGSKVVQIANGHDSVELFSSEEVNTLLGGTGGGSTQATVVISNGDGVAYGIHTEGCVYKNGIWYACFGAKNTSGRNLPVRINFIIMAI